MLLREAILGSLLYLSSSIQAKNPEDIEPLDPEPTPAYTFRKSYCVLSDVGKADEFFPQECDDFFHETFRLGMPEVRSCGLDRISNTTRSAYIGVGSQWYNPEHCRAGCETCFMAAEAKRARFAVCRREELAATCGMGISYIDPEVLGTIRCQDDMTQCELNWTSNKFKELGQQAWEHKGQWEIGSLDQPVLEFEYIYGREADLNRVLGG